jgi:hypothetical protein
LQVLVAVTVMLLSGPLAAEPSEADIATARELAKQAFAAYDAHDYAKAETLFEKASDLYPAPTLLLGLARSRVKLGKYVKARENYNRIIKSNLPDTASDAFVEAQESARKEVLEVEPKLAWVTITVQGVDPEQLTVTLDGEEVPSAAIGVKRPVDPGGHAVRALGDGWVPFEAPFQIAEGGAKSVVVTMQPAPSPKPDGQPDPHPQPLPAPAPSTQMPGSPLTIVGFVLLGVGGASLIAGAITGGIAVGQHGELSDNCVDNRCEPAQYDTLDGFELTSTISTVTLIAGGVIAAAGLTLVLVAPSSDEPASALVTVGPASLSLSATF